MSRTMPNTLQIDLGAEPNIQGMVRELEATRYTLAKSDSFQAMTPKEQALAVVDLAYKICPKSMASDINR